MSATMDQKLQVCQEDMPRPISSASSASSITNTAASSPVDDTPAPQLPATNGKAQPAATTTATVKTKATAAALTAPAPAKEAATTTATTVPTQEQVVALDENSAASDSDDGDELPADATKKADADKANAPAPAPTQQADDDDDEANSCFSHVKRAPPNKIFKLQDEYVGDKHEHKSNLVLGVAVNDDGSLVYFDTVRAVEEEIYEDTQSGKLSHGYPPIGGLPELSRGAAELVLGEDHAFVRDNKVQGVQALSGTGALRLVGEFLYQYHTEGATVHLSNPTWANHKAIFTEAGFDTIKDYRYYDNDTRGLDFDGLMEDLEDSKPGDIVVLHACAHNPTGVDPTLPQWTAIADLCKRKHLMPVFDCAYLGFASGNIDEDAEAMRHFANTGLEFFVCMSFSKNFGIYGQRCGSALFVSEDSDVTSTVISQLKRLSRPMWSVPPLHGARIVTRILGNPELRSQWKKEVRDLAERIRDIRQRLRAELEECTKGVAPEGCWDHITSQRGMFTFSGLRPRQCEFLKTEHNIYMLPSGRINVCGVSSSKLSRIASAIAEAYIKECD